MAKLIIVVWSLIISLLAPTQIHGADLKSLLVPSPVSVALTIGQWLLKDNKKVYYIQVESSAGSFEQARLEGLRLAVDRALGTLIVSETEVRNHRLVRNDIIKYSAGYINDFNTISQTQVGNKVTLVMDVWVSESKIADRLLNESKVEAEFDGNRAALQHSTYLQDLAEGDRLLQMVTNDFPERAFVINVDKVKWSLVGRALEIYIPVNISWSKEYIAALEEVLVKTRQGKNSMDRNYGKWKSIIGIRTTESWFKTYAAYSDKQKEEILHKNIILKQPLVMAVIKDENNTPIFAACFTLEHLRGGFYVDSVGFGLYALDGWFPGGQFFAVSAPDAHIAIYGDYKLRTNLKLVSEDNVEDVSRMKSVEVGVVPKTACET